MRASHCPRADIRIFGIGPSRLPRHSRILVTSSRGVSKRTDREAGDRADGGRMSWRRGQPGGGFGRVPRSPALRLPYTSPSADVAAVVLLLSPRARWVYSAVTWETGRARARRSGSEGPGRASERLFRDLFRLIPPLSGSRRYGLPGDLRYRETDVETDRLDNGGPSTGEHIYLPTYQSIFLPEAIARGLAETAVDVASAPGRRP